MRRPEIIATLEPVLRDVLGVPAFDPGLNMDNVDAWDSLRHINLVIEIEKAFAMQFQDLAIAEMVSLERILEIIESAEPQQ